MLHPDETDAQLPPTSSFCKTSGPPDALVATCAATRRFTDATARVLLSLRKETPSIQAINTLGGKIFGEAPHSRTALCRLRAAGAVALLRGAGPSRASSRGAGGMAGSRARSGGAQAGRQGDVELVCARRRRCGMWVWRGLKPRGRPSDPPVLPRKLVNC